MLQPVTILYWPPGPTGAKINLITVIFLDDLGFLNKLLGTEILISVAYRAYRS